MANILANIIDPKKDNDNANIKFILIRITNSLNRINANLFIVLFL